MRNVPCPVCGILADGGPSLATSDYVTGERFAVIRCSGCGTGLTSPQPADLGAYYPVSYRRYRRPMVWLLKQGYRRRMQELTRTLDRKGVALDLGCGGGWMLEVLHRNGWHVVGVERSQQTAAAALRGHGVPVFVGDLEAVRPDPCLDVVIIFHVLEHLPDPAAALRQCVQRLKPGGTLLVAVPNFASWQAQWSGGAWWHLDAPRHLFHFTRASLRRFLEEMGLEVIRIHGVSWEHDPYGWLQSGLNRLGFPQNQLMTFLMGHGGSRRVVPQVLLMGIAAVLLVVPSVVLSAASWLAGRGAMVEVLARKPVT